MGAEARQRGKMLVIVPNPPTRIVTKGLGCVRPLCLALVAAFLLLVGSASAEVTGPVAEPGSAASTGATPVAQGTEQGEETGVGVPVGGSAPEATPPAAAQPPPPAPSQPAPAPVAGEAPPPPPPASSPPAPPPAEAGPPASPTPLPAAPPPAEHKEEVPTPVTSEAPPTPKVGEHGAEAAPGTSATGSPPSAPGPRAAEVPNEGPVWLATTPQGLPQLGASPVEGAGPSGGAGRPAPPTPLKASSQWPAQLGVELSALGLPMTGGPKTPWGSAQPLLAATPAKLAAEADSLETGPAGAVGGDGHSGSGAPPVTPGPGPAPGGAAGGASGGSGGIALSGLLPLAGLLLLAGPRAIRRLRLSCLPLLTAGFVLIPERPG
jgi:hypothetical protein